MLNEEKKTWGQLLQNSTISMVTQNKSSMPITYGFSRNGYLKRVLVILLGIEFLNIKTIQWNSRHMDSGNV